MRLHSWNINGIRAVSAKNDWSWFIDSDSDIIALQETKADEDQVPEEHRNPAGYHSYWFSSAKKKGYSGVAAFSRTDPIKISFDLPNP